MSIECRCPAERGVSLIELVIFIVIVSIGLTGMLSTLSATLKHSADPMIQKQMLSIAESMMDEIQSKNFASAPDMPSPTSKACATYALERAELNKGGSAVYYDDVSDYDGVTDCPIYSLLGNQLPGLESYRLSISVSGNGGLNGLSSSLAKLIVVTVQQGGERLVLQGWRTSYGP